VQSKEKRRILIGGLITITLGVLILLNSLGLYGFNKSWPILLLSISLGTLLQNWRDRVGWFLAFIAFIFLIKENFYAKLEAFTTYGVPLLLIIIGSFVVMRGMKK
jgi:hypothetical protein